MTRKITVSNAETGAEIARCTLADFFWQHPEMFAGRRAEKNAIRQKLSRGLEYVLAIEGGVMVRLSVSRGKIFPSQPNPEL